MSERPWRSRPFEELFAEPLRNGISCPKSGRGSGVKLINMGELFAYPRIGNVNADRAPLPANASEVNWILEPGDLLFARQSLKLDGAGQVSLVLPSDEPRTWEGHLIRVRLDPATADPGFFYYFFRSATGRSLMGTIIEQVAAAGIRGSDLKRLQVPVPDLKEQRRIGDMLGALDDKIDCSQRIAGRLDSLASCIFGMHARMLAETAIATRIDAVASITKGVSYRSENLQASETALVTLKSFGRAGGYRSVGLKPYTGPYKVDQLLQPGDVAVAQTDLTQRAEVLGRAIRVPPSEAHTKLVASLDLAVVRPKDERLTKEFLFFALNELTFREHCRAFANGTTVLHLGAQAIPCYELDLPDADQVAQVSDEVRPLLVASDHARVEAQHLGALRDALLPRLMSGQLRLKDAEAVVEDVA